MAARFAPPASRLSTSAAAPDALERIARYPGVTWFNDQYLLPPSVDVRTGLGSGTIMSSDYGAAMAVLVRADDGTRVREPCGGAILAVNGGDPDPRTLLALVRLGTPGVRADLPDDVDDISGDVDQEGADAGAVVVGDTRDHGRDGTHVDPTGAHVDLTDQTVEGAATSADASGLLTYVESYLLADPMGHSWIVDKYLGRVAIRTDGELVEYGFPIWAANMHGAASFVPDTRTARVGSVATDDCTALRNTDESGVADPVEATFCGVESMIALPTFPLVEDDPCMGYLEPGHNGYCYSGVMVDLTGACPEMPRRTSALLYFRWDELTVAGDVVDHSSPLSALDTNGCHSGTEWPCPGDEPWSSGAAFAGEGNSHSFHPFVPPHLELGPCPVPGGNPTNHGGSPEGDAGSCDYLHASAFVDVYYSGSGRPAEPPLRSFAIIDDRGSSEGFADFHCAYQMSCW